MWWFTGIITRHTVVAVPRWEPETVAWAPETVSRKGLQVTKSLEASPPPKTGGRGRGFACERQECLEAQNRCLEAL
jgi:hypothetical protein